MTSLQGKGMYCEDCDKIMDMAEYSMHNADHTLRRITWDFVTSQKKEADR